MAAKRAPKSSGDRPKDRNIHERTIEGMDVTMVGKGFYECSSESDANTKYHVDILALPCPHPLGECDCWDFIARRKVRWKNVRKPYDIFRCKHLRRVRNHVLDQILLHTIQKEQKGKK
jgi:hypothetical protein